MHPTPDAQTKRTLYTLDDQLHELLARYPRDSQISILADRIHGDLHDLCWEMGQVGIEAAIDENSSVRSTLAEQGDRPCEIVAAYSTAASC